MKTKALKDTVDRRQLQQLVAKLNEGVLLLDAAGTFVWANAAALMMHGCCELDEFGDTASTYRKRFALKDGNGRALLARNYPVARLVSGGSLSKTTVVVLRRDDRQFRRAIEFSGSTLKNSRAQAESLVLIMNDVTEQYDAQERFERAFASNPAPAIILRLDDSRFINVNRGFLEMTGYAREDVIRRHLHDLDFLRDAEDRETAIRALDEWSTIRQQESTVQTKEGHRKFVILAAQPIPVDDSNCMLFTFIDLDLRKQMERSLRQSQERFAKVFQMAPVPMLVCMPEDWNIVEANDAFTTTFGHAHEQVVGRSSLHAALALDADAAAALRKSLAADKHVRNRDVVVHSSDGIALDGLLSAELLAVEGNTYLLFVVQDVTARRRSEADLIAAIDAVMKDASWFSQTLMQKLAQIRQPAQSKSELDALTTRERDVLKRICSGMTDAEIAAALHRSRNTVRNHLANLYAKIGVNRRSAAVVWGRERGIGSY